MRYLRPLKLLMVASALLATTHSFAEMSVTPLKIEFDLGSGQPSGEVRARNTGRQANAVEVEVFRRVLSADGEVIEEPADEDFIVFPVQTLIGPGATQVFRLQWVGERRTQSQSYYVYVGELPIDVEPSEKNQRAQAVIGFIYRYGVSVHVIPSGAKSEFVVNSVTPNPMPDGSPGLKVSFENVGKALGRFEDHDLTILSGGDKVDYPGPTLRRGVNGNVLLPKQATQVTFPIKRGMEEPFKATIAPR